MTEAELRQTVRHAYNFACGYCSVREEDTGSELELDHFQPHSPGGGDELENLVYCCTTCNRLKGDFWALATAEKRILHLQRDDLSLHLQQDSNGLLTAFTETGKFHLKRLREELRQAQTAQQVLTEHLQTIDEKI